MTPGVRLRVIASRLCGAQTMERVIDPLIADLQLEHAEAVTRGICGRAGGSGSLPASRS